MGPEPISSSSKSNTCSDVISSNCVGWAGGAISGLNLCAGASVTDVIMGMAANCCSGSGGGTTNPCAANGWVDFSGSIPVSLSGSSCFYKLFGFQNFFGESTFATIVNDKPSYRWTADGNLRLRGVFSIDFSASAQIGYIVIPMGSIASTCFPTSFTKAQTVLTEVDRRLSTNNQTEFMKCYAIADPVSQTLSLLLTFDYVIPGNFRYAISLGGVEFNLG